eukprot:m.42096 g.42096  ORF g.42096 m.42096 type:complete len:642 (-) comp9845_c0_seq1:138-2063(-)
MEEEEEDETGPLVPSEKKGLYRRQTTTSCARTNLFWMCVFVLAILAVSGAIIVTVSRKRDVERSLSNAGYKDGAVATDNEFCSAMGVDVLKEGGGAVDAAIAALLCIGVVNSHSAGIGGGGFMVIYNKNGSEAIDFREVAPAAASQDMFTEYEDCKSSSQGGQGDTARCPSRLGGLAVGVPGELKGMELAHQRHGRLPWAKLFERVIELCEKGFPVSGANAGAIRDTWVFIQEDEHLKRIYSRDGKPLEAGDTLQRPDLARVYRMIAENGTDVFYKGEIAQGIRDAVENNTFVNGNMTLEDLASYEPRLLESLESEYLGSKLYSVPPPAAGSVLFAIMNILQKYNITCESKQGRDAVYYHRMVEAFKFSYAQRYKLADACCNPNNIASICKNQTLCDKVTEAVTEMMSEDFAEDCFGKIWDNETHHDDSWYGFEAYEQKATPGTTHLSVMTSDNEAVAITSTINLHFGSKVMTRHGILLNNEMDDFSSPNITNAFGYAPSEANFIRPYKRPLSSSTPLIVVDKFGDVKLASGASGGSKIITATLQIAMNILSFCDLPEDATKRPRLHHQLIPMHISGERTFSETTRGALEKIGHWWNETSGNGVAQTVSRGKTTNIKQDPDSRFFAASDSSRKGGAKAAGY